VDKKSNIENNKHSFIMEIAILIGKWIAGVLAIILTKNKLVDIVQFVKAIKRNEYIYRKAEEPKKIKDLLVSLREHYQVDRVILYYLHNGHYASNGYSFYKFSCLEEDFDEKLSTSRKADQQNMPIALMMDFLLHYRDEGMIKCSNPSTYTGSIQNLPEIVESLNTKSTYSHIVKDLKGNIVGSLVMNTEFNNKEITDFEYYDNVRTIIGELMTEKK
jgi:hypothetical protein